MRALVVDHRTEVKKNFVTNPALSPNDQVVNNYYPNSVINAVLNANTVGWAAVGGGTLSFVGGDSAVGPALTGLTAERGFGRITFAAGAGSQRVIANIIAAYTITPVVHIAQMYVRGPAGKTIFASVDEYNGGALVGQTFGSEIALTGNWQMISVARTFTTGTTSLVGFYRGNNSDSYAVDFKYAMLAPSAYPMPFYGRTVGRAAGEIVVVERTDLTDAFYYYYQPSGVGIYSLGMGLTNDSGNCIAVPGLGFKAPPAWVEFDLYSTVLLATKVGDNNSYMRIKPELLTLSVGRRYTIAVTGHLPVARAFVEHEDARRIVVRINTPGGLVVFKSPQIPSFPKWTQTIKVTFDIPANATGLEVRLYNGGEFPNIIQYDSLACWEGKGDWDYVGPSMSIPAGNEIGDRPWKFLPATGQGPSVGIPTLGKQNVLAS